MAIGISQILFLFTKLAENHAENHIYSGKFVSDFHDFWSSLSAQDVEQLLFSVRFQVVDRAWFVGLYGEIIPEL